MANTVVEATAVSFRKGSTEEISVFKGVEGEMVVDLDEKTLVMCDGVTYGGHYMARKDMSNVSTTPLATTEVNPLAYANFSNCNTANLAEASALVEGTKLAYNDLSNLEHNGVSQERRDEISSVLRSDYHLASDTILNLRSSGTTQDPADPTDESHTNVRNILKQDFNIAASDASNIHTDNLADVNRNPSLGKNLAYADTSNINTRDLAENRLPQYEQTLGKNLAYADLSNVNLPTVLNSYEVTANKVSEINENNTNIVKYPSTQAVVNLINSNSSELRDEFTKRDLTNVLEWTPALLPRDFSKYTVVATLINSGAGYSVNDVVELTLSSGLDWMSSETIQIKITEVDGSGAITVNGFELLTTESYINQNTPITLTDGGSSTASTRATFSIETRKSYGVNADLSIGGEGYSVEDIVELSLGSGSDTETIRIRVTGVNAGVIIDYELLTTSSFIDQDTPITLTDISSGSYTVPARFDVSTYSSNTRINGGNVLSSDLSNISEALNILKVKEMEIKNGNFTLQLKHRNYQVYPVTITDGLTDVTINLEFEDSFSSTNINAYVYEIHITVGNTLPNITWVLTGQGTGVPLKWMQYVPGPVEANKTSLFIVRQQQNQVIANYAGCY